MSARDRITKEAERSGYVNKSTEDERRYWCIDNWQKPGYGLRVTCDSMGRVRSASYRRGNKSRVFIGTGVADQILDYLKGITK
jgi:hypothetical protein